VLRAQAIAAMDRALEADPSNLEVLLSLGVSHTNELDQAEALTYLHRWLSAHPEHGAVAAQAPPLPDSSQRHSYVVRAAALARAAPVP
jgi:peroxin-5